MNTDKQITVRMPKELLDKWLAALRSGEYEQGHDGYMVRNGAYCCLGVLVKVSSTANHDNAYPSDAWMSACDVSFYEANGRDRRGSQPYVPALGKLVGDANDGGTTFPEIADAIEACAEGL